MKNRAKQVAYEFSTCQQEFDPKLKKEPEDRRNS